MPPGMIDQQVPDGQRRLNALAQGGFSAQDQMNYKTQRTQALVQGGYTQQEVNDYWGDKPNASPTADQASLSSVVQHAGSDFASPIAGAWVGLEAQQKRNWQHQFKPDMANLLTGGAVDAAATLWDGLNVVFSPVVGAVNTVGAPAGRALGAAGVPAPHFTVDLKSPTSNLLDPTQWQFKADMVHGEAAGAEYGQVLTGLGSLAIGGKGAKEALPVRAAPAARSAAIAAFRSGEISDTAAFPSTVVRGKVSPQIQAQFPGMDEYIGSAKTLTGGEPEATNRVVKNMQDVWVQTGLSPSEQSAIAARNPIIRQQLLSQDINGDPVTPGLNDAAPQSASSHPVQQEQGPTFKPTEPGQEPAQSRPAMPTFVPTVDKAMDLMAQLEGSPDIRGQPQVSRTGAVGKFQIEPGTARQYGFDPARLRDPAYNALAARAIIGDLFKRYEGNMEAMSIAYNDGPGRANQWLRAGPGTRLEAVRDNSVRSGWRYEKVASARDESFMPMETQQYVARARSKMGGTEAEPVVAEQPQFPQWKPETLPQSVAEQEARGGIERDTSLSAASVWDHASPEDVTKEILSNTGEQPRGDLFPDYMKYDRLMSDYVSVLHPFEAVDKALVDKGFLEDPDRDFTTRKAFQQVNGADSRMSSFILDGIVEHNGFDYRIKPNSPSYADAFKQMSAVGNRDEWVASMLARRTNNAATRFVDAARIELAKAQTALEKAAEPFRAENFDLTREDDPRFAKQKAAKEQAETRVAQAQAAFEKAMKEPGIDTGFNPFASARVDADPYWRKYDEPTETYQTVKAGILQYAVDTGRLSESSMQSMLHTDPIHISMQRLGVDSKLTGFNKLEGSDRKVVSDPIAADFANGQWIIKQSDRAVAVNFLLDKAAQNPDIMTQFGLKKSEVPGEDEEAIDAALRGHGYSPEQMDAAREAFGAIIQARMDERLTPNQFPRYVDGKREVWETSDENLARSLRNPVGPGQMEAMVKVAKWVSMAERSGIMAGLDWAPDIGIFHQLTQNQYDFLHPTPGVTLVEGFLNNLLHTDLAKQARASGAFSSSIVDMNGSYLAHLEADLTTTGMTGYGAKLARVKDLWSDESSAHLNWNTVVWPVQFMRMMTELVDESNRTGLYAQGVRAKMGAAAAGARARRTGLDYADHGASQIAQLMTQAAPMYQGYIKGTELGNAALIKRPASTVAWIGVTVGLATALNYALNVAQDNDSSIPEAQKWRNIPAYDKDRYLITPLIAGERIRLRLPSGLAGAFAAVQQRFMDAMMKHDPHAFNGVLNDLIQDNVRLPVPAVVNAPIEAASNHSFYTGHPLIPGSMEALAPQQQLQPYTSPLSIAIANKLDPLLANVGGKELRFSPVQLDHLIAGWTGPAGMALAQQLGTPERPGPPTDIATIPGISRLFERNPGANAQLIANFYDDKARFDQAFAERTEARRQAGGETYARWLSQGAIGAPPASGDPYVDQRLRRAAIQDAPYALADRKLDQLSGALGKMRDAAWSIYASKQTDDAKRQQITQLYTNMIATAHGASTEMEKFEQEHPLHAH